MSEYDIEAVEHGYILKKNGVIIAGATTIGDIANLPMFRSEFKVESPETLAMDVFDNKDMPLTSANIVRDALQQRISHEDAKLIVQGIASLAIHIESQMLVKLGLDSKDAILKLLQPQIIKKYKDEGRVAAVRFVRQSSQPPLGLKDAYAVVKEAVGETT